MVRVAVVFFLLTIFGFLYAAGENNSDGNPSYILEDFELTTSEKKLLADSNNDIQVMKLDFNKDNNERKVVLVYKIGDSKSKQLENLMQSLVRDGYISNLDYYYIVPEKQDDKQSQLVEIKIRLVLHKYLPLVFNNYINLRQYHNTDISTALFYSGVSPDVVFELSEKYGNDLIKANKFVYKNIDTKNYPLLLVNNQRIENPSLLKLMKAMDYKKYKATIDYTDQKIFLSFNSQEKKIPFKYNSNNIVKLTRGESIKVAEQLGIKKTPFIFLKGDEVSDVPTLYKYGFYQMDEYFVLQGAGDPIYFRNRTLSAGRLDVFIRTNSPDSMKLMKQLAVYKDKITIVLHMVMKEAKGVQQSVPSKFISINGMKEVEENLRQIYLYRKYPTKYWQYVAVKNDNPQEYWKQLYRDLAIDSREIEKQAFSEEGERYIKEALFLVNNLSINDDPLMLWENEYLTGDINKLKKIDSFIEFNN